MNVHEYAMRVAGQLADEMGVEWSWQANATGMMISTQSEEAARKLKNYVRKADYTNELTAVMLEKGVRDTWRVVLGWH